MKNRKLILLTIFLLLIFNAYSLFRFNNLKQFSELNIQESLRNKEIEKLNTYISSYAASILNNGKKIDNSHFVKDSLQNFIPLKNIFDDGQNNILIYRFSKMHCESCVVASMEVLKKQIDSIGLTNVAFLGNYKNNRIYQRTILEYGVEKVKVYNIPSFNIPAEEIGYPYFFVMNYNLEISDIFMPNKATPLPLSFA